MKTSAPAELVTVTQTRRIMATAMRVHLAIRPGQEQRADAAIAGCMRWLERVGERLTRFSAESELARLNAASGWQPVSKLLYNVVAESLAAARASEGLFDPALLPLLEALGYDRDFRALAREGVGTARSIAPTFTAGRWREVELDPAGRRIRLPPGARLDLGGIAKGWAADVALERFFDAFPHVLLDAGGDMRVRGGPEEDGCWALGIGDPRADASGIASEASSAVVLTLGRGGLATSGATTRWWYQDGERRHHLLDPRTGLPARLWIDPRDDSEGGPPLIATATALAPTAAHAEVAAKVALLRGYPGALHAVEAAWRARDASCTDQARMPTARYGDEEVALILILGNGAVVCSAHIREYLAALGGGGELWLQ
ncbi:MAG TPA: FAD:protein FMN transferase [Ktedonobacterales bacterium]|jgi:thiamine biosynthesis lipoprotein